MFRALLLFSLPFIIYSLPTIRIGEHCGPKELHTEVSKKLARNLAKELARSADFAHKELGLSKEKILRYTVIGTKLDISHDGRARAISNIFEAKFDSNKDLILFTAKFEVNRIERWSRDLGLLNLDPSKTLVMAMSMPWEQKIWNSLDLEQKKELIFQEMRKDLCNSY